MIIFQQNVCRELLAHDTPAQIKYVKEPLKDTALHLAGRRRDNDMIKMFIEAGSVVDGKNVRMHSKKLCFKRNRLRTVRSLYLYLSLSRRGISLKTNNTTLYLFLASSAKSLYY